MLQTFFSFFECHVSVENFCDLIEIPLMLVHKAYFVSGNDLIFNRQQSASPDPILIKIYDNI